MDYQQFNNEAYDHSAQQLAEYFRGIGPRTEDIERALTLAGNPQAARVVEIGCGDGRDAAEIVPRVAFYQGFDPSAGMLELAKVKVPQAEFIQATATSFAYPENLDVVYAFASLLHVQRNDLPLVFQKVAQALRPGGIFYISTKESQQYKEEIKKDQYGERMFYFYNAQLLEIAAGKAFHKIYEDHQQVGSTDWITIAFQK